MCTGPSTTSDIVWGFSEHLSYWNMPKWCHSSLPHYSVLRINFDSGFIHIHALPLTLWRHTPHLKVWYFYCLGGTGCTASAPPSRAFKWASDTSSVWPGSTRVRLYILYIPQISKPRPHMIYASEASTQTRENQLTSDTCKFFSTSL